MMHFVDDNNSYYRII